ncbi:MAG: hypothetical protein GY703_01990 [Gammaproteobacteria bacterium]|nr:hypothetical protein [Gammaproteobacteria bacterium]
MNNHRITTALILISVVSVLYACASSAPVPQDHFYRLTAPDSPRSLDVPPISGKLTVDRVRASGLLRERALLYSLESTPEELKQHRYHHWVDVPSTMIRAQLIAYLRSLKPAGHETGPLSSDVSLRIELKRLERVLRDNGKGVSVSLELELEASTRKDAKPILVKVYTVEQPAQDSTVLASVRAMDLGIQMLFDQMLTDLHQAVSSS